MDKMSPTSNRGGCRIGAGRKRSQPTKAITTKIPIKLLERVDAISKNRTKFICDALTEKLERM